MIRETYTNKHGNEVACAFFMERERYHYDEKLGAGWYQYDTDQDAPYFGCWVNAELRQIVTWCEGDESRTTCPTVESFQAELDGMAECYGPAPSAARAIGADGSVEVVVDPRPGVDHAANKAQHKGFMADLGRLLGG
jgi:hypothetical protein